MKLRDYQQQAVDSLYDYFRVKTGNPLIVLPTGSGKSHVIAAFIHGLYESWPNQRVIMLTHVKELIEQNYLKLLDHWQSAKLSDEWQDAPVGIYSAGLNRRDFFDPIIFASIQSVYSKSNQLGKFNLVIVDEAHLINHKADGMYRKFIDDQLRMNPSLKIIGLTATPFRTSHGNIVMGDSPLFTDICYEKNVIDLINDGYLAPLISKRTATRIDLSKVHSRGGEFIPKELDLATNQHSITKSAVKEIIEYGHGRQSWLVFCTSIDHAAQVEKEFSKHDITCKSISSKTTKKEREIILKEYKLGSIKAISNVNVLTTGFDAPAIDLIAFLRGTKSPGLYIQMCGRGMRPSKETGKKDCLVLDFAGNVSRHGPVDQVKPWAPTRKRKQAAPTKDCPDCDTILASSIRICPLCEHEFYTDEIKHDSTASELSILSIEIEEKPDPMWFDVDSVTYKKHRKRGNPDAPKTLKVEYQCGMRWFNEWVALEHDGWARRKAISWWSQRMPVAAPMDIDDAIIQLEKHAITPVRIHVDESDKYPRILDYECSTVIPDSTQGHGQSTETSTSDFRESGAGHDLPDMQSAAG